MPRIKPVLVTIASMAIGASALWLFGPRVVLEPQTEVSSAPGESAPGSGVVTDRGDQGGGVSPPGVESEGNVGTESKRWLQEFSASDDLYAFAMSAAEPAFQGDHRAQYFLAQALLDCGSVVALVNLQQKGSFAANVDATMAPIRSNEQERTRLASRISRCERYFSRNPLADLGLSSDQQAFKYWSDQALNAGDAFAVLDRAQQRSISDNLSKDTKQQVLADIETALQAGADPGVLMKVASVYRHPRMARDVLQSIAWTLAACSAGFDCSTTNPDVGFGCAEAGNCNAGLTLPDIFQRDLTPKQYAEAYAASQDILYRIEARDWDGLEPYLATAL